MATLTGNCHVTSKILRTGMALNMVDRKYSGYIFAFSCVLMWSFIPIVSRFGQSELDNFQFLFWSNILSLVVVSICMITQKGINPLKNFCFSQINYILFLGALGCSIYYLCLYYGYAKGNNIEVLILQYSWPLQIILLSVIILKEKLSIKSWISIFAGLLGIVIVLTKGDIVTVKFSTLDVSLIVLLGAFCFSLFSVLSKKLNAEPFTVTVILFLGGNIVSTLSLFSFSDFQYPSGNELVPVIVNGALINGISYILWLIALEKITASTVAVIVFLTPMFSAIWIVLFFDEPFHVSYIAGFILVLVAGFFCIKFANHSKP